MMEYHNNSQTRHNWKTHYAQENGRLVVAGFYCECGAYIMAHMVDSILSFYSANDIASGVIEDRIMHHNFDAKAYEESMK